MPSPEFVSIQTVWVGPRPQEEPGLPDASGRPQMSSVDWVTESVHSSHGVRSAIDNRSALAHNPTDGGEGGIQDIGYFRPIA
jgi:hypothetical protein